MQINWNFLKLLQARWGIMTLGFSIFVSAVFFSNQMMAIQKTPQKIEILQGQISQLHQSVCQSIKYQKAIIINNASISNAMLMSISQEDTKSIEIVKEIAKKQLEINISQIDELINQCNA